MKLNYFLVPVIALLGLGELRAQSADSTPSPGPKEDYHEHGHGRRHHAWIWKKLNLTDDQKTKIKTIRQDMKVQTRPALAAVLTAKLKLQQDIDANSDQGIIAADTSALATAETQFATARATMLSRVKTILTQDQLTTWSDFQKKRQARMQNWIEKLNQPTT